MIERTAGLMRRRTAGGAECFVVAEDDRWLRLSADQVVQERFLADGFEAGYVWSEHVVSVGRKQFRQAKKDGWFEHGQNAAEYCELTFGVGPRATPSSRASAPSPAAQAVRGTRGRAEQGPLAWMH